MNRIDGMIIIYREEEGCDKNVNMRCDGLTYDIFLLLLRW